MRVCYCTIPAMNPAACKRCYEAWEKGDSYWKNTSYQDLIKEYRTPITTIIISPLPNKPTL